MTIRQGLIVYVIVYIGGSCQHGQDIVYLTTMLSVYGCVWVWVGVGGWVWVGGCGWVWVGGCVKTTED